MPASVFQSLSTTVLFCQKKVSVIHLSPAWCSLCDFYGVIVCVDLNEHNLLAKLIMIHFYDRNKIRLSTRDGQSLFPFMPGLTNEKSHRVVWSKNSFMEISSCKKLTLLKNASSNWKWANSNGTIFYWSNWMYFVFLFFRFSVYDLQFWTFLQGTSGMAFCVSNVPCSSPQWRFLISVINLLM